MKRIVCLLFVALLITCPALAQEARKNLGLSVSNTFTSAQVAPDGSVIVDNTVNQSYLELSTGPISLYYWNNYDLKEDEVNEYDLGVFINLPKFWGLKPYLDLQRWHYPKGNSDFTYEDAVSIGIKHSDFLNTNLKFTRQLGAGSFNPGNRAWLSVAKSFDLFDSNLILTPKVQAAYLNNFFDVSGLAHATLGLDVAYPLGNNFALTAYINWQEGFEMENKLYGSITFSWVYK